MCKYIYIDRLWITTRGSHVFVCSVDFNKAFDNVGQCKLFSKLLGDNVNYSVIVRLLDFRYSKQECHVSSVMFSLQVS